METRQLTIKHLAPYLPYGLNIRGVLENTDNETGIWKMSANDSFVDVPLNAVNGTDLKPLLRPLSDLTKLIKVEGYNDGKEFEPFGVLLETADELDFNMLSEDCAWFFTEPNFSNITELGDMNSLPYWLNSLLCQWHFDVFGLIPEGLAKDINEVEI